MDDSAQELFSNPPIAAKECNRHNRECPECGFTTIKGMPGGRDATCENCGYKDPCCYDY